MAGSICRRVFWACPCISGRAYRRRYHAGPLNICVTIIGEVAKGKALRRSGARPGDDIWISGHLGDAALALAHEQRRIMLEPGEIAHVCPRCIPLRHGSPWGSG